MARDFGALEGRLLIAHAILRDPNFRRTVIFICDHDPDDGAYGLVLNRPLDQTAADFLPDDADATEVLAQVPVFHGGPVGSDRLVFADFGWDKRKKIATARHALGMTEVTSLVEEGKAAQLRAFVGYAGWSGGQLEEELAQGSWVLADAVASTFHVDHVAKLWSDTLSRLGPAYRLMALKPDNPSLN
jgi:putative transcriptional regulator